MLTLTAAEGPEDRPYAVIESEFTGADQTIRKLYVTFCAMFVNVHLELKLKTVVKPAYTMVFAGNDRRSFRVKWNTIAKSPGNIMSEDLCSFNSSIENHDQINIKKAHKIR